MFSKPRLSLTALLLVTAWLFMSPAQATVTFAGVDGVEANVITAGGCSGCHGTTTPSSCTGTAVQTPWLSTSSQSAARTTVSNCATDVNLKIHSSPSYGVQMPYGGPYLSAGAQSLFSTWISNGKLLSTTPNYASVTSSSVNHISATLNMSVYANGSAVTAAYFKYSTSSATVGGGGGTTVSVSSGLPTATGGGTSAYALSVGTGNVLNCNTTYYYRAYASNSSGSNVSNGSTNSFLTSSCTAPTISGTTTVNSYEDGVNATDGTLTAIPVSVSASSIEYSPSYYWDVTVGSIHGATVNFSSPTSNTSPGLTYTPQANYNGPDSFTIRVCDGGAAGVGNCKTQAISVNLTAEPDSPVVSASGTINYTEGDPATTLDSGLTVSDADGDQMQGGTVVIGNYQSADGEVLACGSTFGGISCGFSSGTLTLSGTTTTANYQSTLRTVTYYNPSANPTTSPSRSVQFKVQDNSASALTSAVSSVTVTVSSVSTPPTITGFSGTTAFTEQTPIIVDSSVTITDPDSPVGNELNRARMTLSLTNYTTSDSLVCPSSGLPSGISCSYDAPSRTLTLSSASTNSLADYQNAIALVKFNNTSDKPTSGNRTVTLTARDSSNTVSSVVSKTISIKQVNDPPVINATAPTTAMVLTEGVPASFYNVNPAGPNQITDPDDSSFTYSLGGTGLSGAVTSTGTTGDMAIDGTGQISWTPPRTGVFNKATATVTITVTDTNSSGASNGTQSTTQTFSVATSPPDSDGDGIADYSDNCPGVANASQADMDNDTVHGAVDPSGIPANGDVDPTAKDANGFLTGGDACDEDIDGDGMPNTYENLYSFLNPLDPTDAAKDYDGDGVSNLAEYRAGTNPALDTVGPVVTAPPAVTVNSTGYLTDVDLGFASALDGNDGSINSIVPIIDATISACSELANYPLTAPPFRPGLHIANWSTCDSAGNLSYATQNVRVRPILSTTPGQTVGAGQVAVVRFMLNGPAADYPVSVHYQLGGTASSSDYNISSGILTIGQTDVDGNNPGRVGKLNITIASTIAQDETLTIRLSNAVNAVLGPANTTQVAIVNHDTTPVLTTSVTQNGVATGHTVYVGAGAVVLTVNTTDTHPATAPAFDWSRTDNAIGGIGSIVNAADSSSMSFSPSSLAAGTYPVAVTVNDGGQTNTTTFILNVAATAPDLADCNLDGVADTPANTDCDGDGIANTTEGAVDSNGNGIPDYLDDNRIVDRNVLQNETGDPANTYLMATDPGLQLRLGTTALASDASGALVSQQNINQHGSLNGGAGMNPQDSDSNDGGFYDFEVTGLNDMITSAHVVIPLQAAILNNAVYRNYNGSAWSSFVVDANNTISSAPGSDGVCPAPGSIEYSPGLTPLNTCIELLIEDGGPNDADGVRDYVIRDPGGVAIPPAEAAPAPDKTKGGAGVMHPALLLLVLAIFSLLAPRRKVRSQTHKAK